MGFASAVRLTSALLIASAFLFADSGDAHAQRLYVPTAGGLAIPSGDTASGSLPDVGSSTWFRSGNFRSYYDDTSASGSSGYDRHSSSVGLYRPSAGGNSGGSYGGPGYGGTDSIDRGSI